ncbi:glycosyltransferase family 2 protein [candidate division KSB1 bacterium]|nr:glycosyltransferase family 2 protein [candidate division KSB1 bacterium]
MQILLIAITILSLATLFYIFIGYPFLIGVLCLILPGRKIKKEPIRPTVSFLISCYNEESVIREKLENTLAIDYPQDKIEIIVISDGSKDKTDSIVREYAVNGVKLIRQEGRLGKTMGLNLAVAQATGDIVVFSDANAMYRSNAVIKLVENFANGRVGYVVGEARYVDSVQSAASRSENTYWQYEILLKTGESRLHSIVGGDGAIYAIRRELFEELQRTDINDFVNPLQIIAKGYRGIYEPEAICEEETSGSFEREIGRKIRIVNRSFSGLLRVKSVMNPFKTGFFSLEIISHKLLRWLTPFFLFSLLFSLYCLSFIEGQGQFAFQIISLLTLIFLGCSYIGYVFSKDPGLFPLFHYPYYFIAVNVAALIGVFRSLQGTVQATWNPVREQRNSLSSAYSEGIWVHAVACAIFVVFLILFGRVADQPYFFLYFLFGGALFFVVYVYLGYPLALYAMSRFAKKIWLQKENFPTVTLLICAYNEENVIVEKIKNSLSLDYPNDKIKIVIASDGSSDQTVALIKKNQDDRLVLYDYHERKGKIGAILATTPKIDSAIVVFSDANTLLREDALQKITRNFHDTQVGGVSADVILDSSDVSYGSSESVYYKIERWVQQKESEIGSIIGADGGLYAIRREVFVPPSDNIILDDFVISMNVPIRGYRLVFDKEIIATEKGSGDHFVEFRRKSRVIAGAFQALRQYEGIPSMSDRKSFFCFVSHKLLRWQTPLFLLVILLSNFFLVLSHPHWVALFAILIGQILFYLLALLGFFFKKQVPFKLISIPFYFCLVNAAAFCGFYKGVFNQQSVKWRKEAR